MSTEETTHEESSGESQDKLWADDFEGESYLLALSVWKLSLSCIALGAMIVLSAEGLRDGVPRTLVLVLGYATLVLSGVATLFSYLASALTYGQEAPRQTGAPSSLPVASPAQSPDEVSKKDKLFRPVLRPQLLALLKQGADFELARLERMELERKELELKQLEALLQISDNQFYEAGVLLGLAGDDRQVVIEKMRSSVQAMLTEAELKSSPEAELGND